MNYYPIILLSVFVAAICVMLPFGLKEYKTKKDFDWPILYGIIIFGLFGTLILGMCISNLKPQAIDVYRGKTELQVTYKTKNGKIIDTDTVIVFNNKKLK